MHKINKPIPFHFLYKYLKILFKEKVDFSRVLNPLSWVIKIIVFEPFRLLDILITKSKKQKPSHDPIIILGHFRSGTTFIQEILSLDNRFGYLNIYKATFPESFISTEKWFKPIVQFFSTLTKAKLVYHRRALDLDIPGEEEFACQMLMCETSSYWGHVFPRKYHVFYDNGITDDEDSMAITTMEYWNYVVQKLMLHYNKPIVLKNPNNTARIRSILKYFPNAKFVFLHRNPYQVFYSNLQSLKSIKPYAFQSIGDEELIQLIIRTYLNIHDSYCKYRSLIPAENLVEIPFENLKNSPKDQVQYIYKELIGLDYESIDNKVNDYLKNNPFSQKEYKYKEEDIKLINDSWEAYFKIFGYQKLEFSDAS